MPVNFRTAIAKSAKYLRGDCGSQRGRWRGRESGSCRSCSVGAGISIRRKSPRVPIFNVFVSKGGNFRGVHDSFGGAQVDDRGGRFHGTTPSISLLNPIRYEVCRRTSGSGSIFRPGRAENHCPGGVPRSRSFAAGNSRRAQSACNSPWMLSRFRRDFAPARMQTARLVTLQ